MSPKSNQTHVIRIFASCAQEDRAFLRRLEQQLSSLKRGGLIQCYNRYGIGPGIERRERAKAYLHAADLILLLVSPAFVAAVELAEVLDLPEKSEPSQPSIVKAVKRWLQQHDRWLLVIR
jgi:hypothetical protein